MLLQRSLVLLAPVTRNVRRIRRPASVPQEFAPPPFHDERPPSRPIASTVVLDLLDDTAEHNHHSHTALSSVTGRELWNRTRVSREKKDVREINKVFVCGGTHTIARIWHRYKIRPNVVYVPDTEVEIPKWCQHTELPAIVVRAPPVDINKLLLGSEHNDGYAAEFPLPVQPPLALATSPPTSDNPGGGRLRSVLVLFRVRIPSNVGSLCRAAVETGYDAVCLIGCAEAFSEKVVRASEGTILSPRLKVFRLADDPGSAVATLTQIARAHHLLPILGVPDQSAEPIFLLARKLHQHNAAQRREPAAGVASSHSDCGNDSDRGRSPPPLGSMLILGSEAAGLDELRSLWNSPAKVACVPLANSLVDSMNVGHAGTVMMNLLTPRAEEKFMRLPLSLPGSASSLLDDDDPPLLPPASALFVSPQ